MEKRVNIPTPDRVRDLIEAYDSIDEYDVALGELLRVFPANTNFHQLLIKVVALNRLYSTQILAVFDVAKHILEGVPDVDGALARGDLSIVESIATVTLQGKPFRFYSFGSKFCSWHRPEVYPIYDSRVEGYLCALRHRDEGFKFATKDLRNYESFVSVIGQLRERYGLQEFSFKQIDKFIWMEMGTPEVTQGEELV